MNAATQDKRTTTMLQTSGRFLLAFPMVIFGIEHFLFANFVAMIVPPWIPWHLFWAYFVGVALIAAGISIAVKQYSQLAATLLGAIILVFVLLIHSRLLARLPGDLYAASPIFGPIAGRINNAWKDLGLAGGAFLFAGTESENWKRTAKDKLATLGRLLLALAIFAFGVLHFVFPEFAPGIQPMTAAIPFILPGQPLWSYLTGATFLAAGACMFLNKRVRLAATLAGIVILLFALLVWVPWLFRHPQDIAGSNYLKDMGMAGGALILAGAVSRKGD